MPCHKPHLWIMDDNLNRLGLLDDTDIVLDEAALLVASPDHPGVELGPYRQLLEAIAVRLDVVGNGAASAHAHADALSFVLSEEFGFVGDRESYDAPANADLIQVIDRRRGLPVSLAILYVAAARRLGWTANVLDVPGHVLVLVGGAVAPVIIDPFHGGILVEPHHLAALLTTGSEGSEPVPLQVAAMPNRAVIVRLLLNQATRAKQAGNDNRARELYARITAIAPDYGHAWWERARLELAERDPTSARNSLISMLEVTRDPMLRRRVADTLLALAAS
jgi:regulator of sirC expression with transglutaminase-like and TPR domain